MSALRAIDLALASRFGRGDRPAAAAFALASWAASQGHAGLPLAALSEGAFDALLAEFSSAPPAAEAIRAALDLHPDVGPPEAGRPFVIDAGMLYLRRVWTLEREAAARLSALAARRFPVDVARAQALLDALLPVDAGNAPARAALVQAASRGLTLLSGGPGTGKTWTAARLLAFLQGLDPEPLRIAAAAPTGKAAARLGASLRGVGFGGPLSPPWRLPQGGQAPGLVQEASTREAQEARRSESMPEAQTLHRLLGARPFQAEPRYGRERALPVDVLLLDEASMVDLPMMVRLLRALPESARLILLGDPDQLPALGGGRVLADLLVVQNERVDPECAALREAIAGQPVEADPDSAPIQSIALRLSRPHRFTADAPMARLLRAVQGGDGEAALAVLAAGEAGLRAEWIDIDPASSHWRRAWREGFAGLHEGEIESRLAALLRFRVLCAGYAGPRGVEAINLAAEAACLGRRPPSPNYPGRPILIRENAPRLDLWNGDLGVLVTDPNHGLRAWFTDPQGEPRALRLDTLPAHDTAYAMSVHKAQGSEFDQVVLMLPQPDSPLLTREWLYTGLSRARAALTICGHPQAFTTAIAHREQRWSRLPERLRASTIAER